jgi:hypothetical protein
MSNGEAEGSHICSDIAVSQCTGYHTAGLWPREPQRGICLGIKRLPMDRNRHKVEGPT